MYEVVTLILVLYVVGSIMRRSADRHREMERLNARVSQLSKVVRHMQQGVTDEFSHQLIELELKDLQMQLHGHKEENFDFTADSAAQEAFEHLHYVEETMSRSVVLAPDMPLNAEATLS